MLTETELTYLTDKQYALRDIIPQDASSRRYYRVAHVSGRSAMFMVANPLEVRAGYRISDFVDVAAWLRGIGLSAPEILDIDERQGFVLLEDFGHVDFKQAITRGDDMAALYGLGHEVLEFWRDRPVSLALPNYFESVIHHGHRQIIDYFVPVVRGEVNPQGLREAYWEMWEREVEAQLPPCPQGFMHIDYHVENLMWMPGREGLQRCGLLDFQAAMIGPQPYDLVNLLEDARMDVPSALRADILSRYDEDFKLWYRVLGTQFHCRVLGLFVKLPLVAGKTKYVEHIPRLCRYLTDGLEHPVLAPVKTFFDDLGIDFRGSGDIPIDVSSLKYIDDSFL